MIETDQKIFLFLNSLHTPLLDQVMWVLSMKSVWIPLYLFMIWLLVPRWGKKIWIPVVMALLLVLLTDRLTVLIKYLAARPRPCNEPALEGMVQLVRNHCSRGFSFVSGHASNSFALALYTALLLRKKWYTLMIMTWVLLVSYSRIYLGVHYPGDIAGGLILGLLTGTLMASLALLIEKRFMKCT